MRRFELDVTFPTGSILIGGHSALPIGSSAAHAKDAKGQPVLPSTALRGALRESLEALLRGNDLRACAAGSGVDPQHERVGETAPRRCTLDNDAPCIACRVFGTQTDGLQGGQRVFSSLILSDAIVPNGEPDVAWVDRQHVAISRAQRSAADNRLFLRRTPALRGRRLTARGHCIDPELEAYLEAAVRATKHLGSGRSVGLARIDMQLRWCGDIRASEAGRGDTGSGELRVRLTLRSSMALGGPEASDNYRPTRSEIPGSALRGALGFALARVDEVQGNEHFEALVDEGRGAQFGFAYPTRPDASGPAAPWPLTARACKANPHEHGVVDTLIDRIAIAAIDHGKRAKAIHAHALRQCTRCSAPLRSAKGTRHDRAPKTRVITRVALDRRASSAKDGALFSYELVEPGQAFEATIRAVPERSRTLLDRGLRLPMYIGRGASSGWGEVEVELLDPRPQPSLAERGAAFEASIAAHFEAVGLPPTNFDRLVPITFLSPFLPDVGDPDGPETLTRVLGEVDEWVVFARRFVRDGGWDQQTGRPFAELAIAGGAVYVARLAASWKSPSVLERLQELERLGLGRRRHQGYGRLIVFDPIILTRSQTR